MVKLHSPVQADLPCDTSSKSEGEVLSKCEGRLSESIMSLSEDLLQDLFSHDRNSIIFVPSLNKRTIEDYFWHETLTVKIFLQLFQGRQVDGVGCGGTT